MASAAIVPIGWEDIGGTLTEEVVQGLLHLCTRKRGGVAIVDGAGIFAIPGKLAVAIGIVAIDGIAGEHHAYAINEAVATLPLNGGEIVGDAHLLVDDGGERVVEGAARVVAKVEHSHIILIAIVEADGAAVAIPEGVAWANEEFHIVGAEAHAFEFAKHYGRVSGCLHAHPCLGTAELDGIHQIEADVAER